LAKTITLNVPHKLTQDEARSRIQNAIADLRRRFGGKVSAVDVTWIGNHLDFRLTAMGQIIAGRVDVQPQDVRLEVDLPFMLAMLAGSYLKRVEDEGRKLLQ
jgi:putative polyhydroxyalkanoate system protein